MSASSAAKATSAEIGKAKMSRWPVILLIVLASGVLAGFYGINEYAKDTGNIVKNANNNHARFEAIFRDLKEARFRALNIAAATLLQSRVTIEAFATDYKLMRPLCSLGILCQIITHPLQMWLLL